MGWSSLVRIPSLRRSLCHRATSDRNVIDVLTERGLVDNVNGIEQLRKAAVRDEIDNATTSRKPLSVYCGFDPTADALHLGNYVGLVVLEWFQKFGHRAVAVIGGATGRIGDPSGKSEERPVLKHDTVDENARKLKASIEDYLGPSATVLNNYEWIGGMSYLDFLGTVGRHARVGTMLGKESVRSRLQSSVGISFTEFSYQLLQAYDFAHLCQAHDVTVQIGGSDQLGNMQAGVDLARKIKPSGPHLHTLTFPLLTTSDGKKYGKSEKGAIWIDPDRLSPYGLYQFLLRTRDEDVIKLLKTITFLPIEQVEQLEASMASTDYKANSAQRLLAETITRDVHGIDGLKSAQVNNHDAESPHASKKPPDQSASPVFNFLKRSPQHNCILYFIVEEKSRRIGERSKRREKTTHFPWYN